MSLILVVDDEPRIREALELNLRGRGYEVVTAATGPEAVEAVTQRQPDAILLDLGLPGLDGLGVIKAVRGWCEAPIVVLSVRGEERDKVAALDAGADDYLTKPFGVGELMARLRAALRRAPEEPSDPIVEAASFTVDLAARRAMRTSGPTSGPASTEEVHLTPIEWGLVEYLVLRPGRLVPRAELLRAVWGPTYGTEANYLRVHMANVRRKLEPEPGRPVHFITEAGMGYRFEP
ncbi:MAG: response regulator [Microthrixaceae bacterium]|nr:response regulator [Microthrixaceae bacterium]